MVVKGILTGEFKVIILILPVKPLFVGLLRRAPLSAELHQLKTMPSAGLS